MNNREAPSTERFRPERRVLLANPRGFCAGVVRAIEAVERALIEFGAPVYVRRPIVHNRTVIERLEALGAVFVSELADVPKEAIAILSAHGVAPSIWREGRDRRLNLIDATCPLVAKVHGEVATHFRAGRHILLIGHKDHPEVIGTVGQVPSGSISVVSTPQDVARLAMPASRNCAYAVQTTFSVRDAETIVVAIRERFSNVAGPRASNICYATTNRQAAIEQIARESDCVLVVGDATSSNANRLVDVARAAGCPEAALIRDGRDLDWAMIERARTVGLTAAASTPDSSVKDVCDALGQNGFAIVEVGGIRETASFKPVAMT